MVISLDYCSGAPAPEADPGDAFFEFTAEDYARVTSQHAREQRAAEAGLRTGKCVRHACMPCA